MKKLSQLGIGIAGAAMLIAAIAVAFAAEFELRKINPPTLNQHPVYTQVATVSGEKTFVLVAGQTDRPIQYEPRSDSCRHSDWHNQYIGTMDNVERGLAAAGATWDDVVFIRKFTTDMVKYLATTADKENPVPQYFEPFQAPPSTLIEVVALSEPCQLLEIDVMAVVQAS